MNYHVKNKVLLISFFTAITFSAHGYNVYTFHVEQPKLTIGFNNKLLLHHKKHTALSNIALQMQSRTTNDLVEFTKISLNQMSFLYEEESKRARRKNTISKKKRQKLNSWSYTTLNHARYLQEISDSIDIETPIELHIINAGELLFMISGQPIIVNGPLINSPNILEQRIINTICNYKYCDLEFPWLEREPSLKIIMVKAEWRMDEKKQPEYVTNDGLHFIFNDIKNRTRKEEICLSIIKELKLIVYALKETSDKGIFIDWDSIHMESDAEGIYHSLIINAFGDAVTVNMSELTKKPQLTQLTMPWIKAKVEKKPHQQNLYFDKYFSVEYTTN